MQQGCSTLRHERREREKHLLSDSLPEFMMWQSNFQNQKSLESHPVSIMIGVSHSLNFLIRGKSYNFNCTPVSARIASALQLRTSGGTNALIGAGRDDIMWRSPGAGIDGVLGLSLTLDALCRLVVDVQPQPAGQLLAAERMLGCWYRYVMPLHDEFGYSQQGIGHLFGGGMCKS